jgi:hypothetical protein
MICYSHGKEKKGFPECLGKGTRGRVVLKKKEMLCGECLGWGTRGRVV